MRETDQVTPGAGWSANRRPAWDGLWAHHLCLEGGMVDAWVLLGGVLEWMPALPRMHAEK